MKWRKMMKENKCETEDAVLEQNQQHDGPQLWRSQRNGASLWRLWLYDKWTKVEIIHKQSWRQMDLDRLDNEGLKTTQRTREAVKKAAKPNHTKVEGWNNPKVQREGDRTRPSGLCFGGVWQTSLSRLINGGQELCTLHYTASALLPFLFLNVVDFGLWITACCSSSTSCPHVLHSQRKW